MIDLVIFSNFFNHRSLLFCIWLFRYEIDDRLDILLLGLSFIDFTVVVVRFD